MTRVEIPEEEAGRNLRGGVGRLIFEEGRVSRPTYARGSHANSFPSARKKFAISCFRQMTIFLIRGWKIFLWNILTREMMRE